MPEVEPTEIEIVVPEPEALLVVTETVSETPTVSESVVFGVTDIVAPLPDPLLKRLLDTLRFFDLQNYPLTLLELHRYLLAPVETFADLQDRDFDLKTEDLPEPQPAVSLGELLPVLEQLKKSGEVGEHHGFWFLNGRQSLVTAREDSYRYKVVRERSVKRFLPSMRFLPFVRGVAVGGSEAMGVPKEKSDIDLLVFVNREFLWLARTFVSGYFQLFGVRRHGSHTAGRFCLNHYLATIAPVTRERNLYKAMEYLRLRPSVFAGVPARFLENNLPWVRLYFPHASSYSYPPAHQPTLQRVLEWVLKNRFGRWLEQQLGAWQRARIHTDRFTFFTDTELSFHPQSRHVELLAKFFQNE